MTTARSIARSTTASLQELALLHDADRDGKLARSELASAPDPSKFDTIDANGDGFLMVEELDAYTANDFDVMDANDDGSIDSRRGRATTMIRGRPRMRPVALPPTQTPTRLPMSAPGPKS